MIWLSQVSRKGKLCDGTPAKSTRLWQNIYSKWNQGCIWQGEGQGAVSSRWPVASYTVWKFIYHRWKPHKFVCYAWTSTNQKHTKEVSQYKHMGKDFFVYNLLGRTPPDPQTPNPLALHAVAQIKNTPKSITVQAHYKGAFSTKTATEMMSDC